MQINTLNEKELIMFMGILHDLEVLVPDLSNLDLTGELFSEVNNTVLSLIEAEGTLDLDISEIALIGYQLALKFDLDVTPKLIQYLTADEPAH